MLFRNILETPVVETQCIASLQQVTPQSVAAPEFKMELNDLGKVVEAEWLKTIKLRPDMNLELDDYVVMPNHFHGIIFIGENKYNMKEFKDEPECRDAMHRVSTTDDNVNDYPPSNQKNKFGPQSKNLASIVRGFKSSVTSYARKNNISFDWQARFHDHIITSNKEYLRIAGYIVNNPQNWREDKFYVK